MITLPHPCRHCDGTGLENYWADLDDMFPCAHCEGTHRTPRTGGTMSKRGEANNRRCVRCCKMKQFVAWSDKCAECRRAVLLSIEAQKGGRYDAAQA